MSEVIRGTKQVEGHNKITFIHITKNRRLQKGYVFLEPKNIFGKELDDVIVKTAKLEDVKDKTKIIRCRIGYCDNPARNLDCYYPYHTDFNLCEEHDDYLLEDE